MEHKQLLQIPDALSERSAGLRDRWNAFPALWFLVVLALLPTSSICQAKDCYFTLTPTPEVGGGAPFNSPQFYSDNVASAISHAKDWLGSCQQRVPLTCFQDGTGCNVLLGNGFGYPASYPCTNKDQPHCTNPTSDVICSDNVTCEKHRSGRKFKYGYYWIAYETPPASSIAPDSFVGPFSSDQRCQADRDRHVKQGGYVVGSGICVAHGIPIQSEGPTQ